MERQQLIEDNMKLVYFIVNTYYHNYIGDEDIIQVGMIGLCNAANTYDPEKGTFSTYAGRCIKNEINKEFRVRNKQLPTLSLDYEYRGGEDSDSFNLTEMIIGDLDVGYIDLDRIYGKLNKTGKRVLDLLLSGLTSKEISKELEISLQLVNFYTRRIKNLLEK